MIHATSRETPDGFVSFVESIQLDTKKTLKTASPATHKILYRLKSNEILQIPMKYEADPSWNRNLEHGSEDNCNERGPDARGEDAESRVWRTGLALLR